MQDSKCEQRKKSNKYEETYLEWFLQQPQFITSSFNGLDHFLMFNLINYLFRQISNEVLIFHFTGTIKALMNISPESETTIIF